MTIPLSPQKPSFSPKIKTFSFPQKSKIKIQNLGWERRKSRLGTSENDWPIIFTSQSSPYSPFDKIRKGTWYNDEEARILDRLQGWLAVALQMQGFLSSIILNWEILALYIIDLCCYWRIVLLKHENFGLCATKEFKSLYFFSLRELETVLFSFFFLLCVCVCVCVCVDELFY